MGKESKLKAAYKPGETRQSYSNGDKKLYDRDACPAGMDEYIWSATLFFEQGIEKLGIAGHPGRPIIYTELYSAVQSDPDLTKLLDRGTIHTTGIKGEGGIPLVTSGTLYDFLVRMISSFFTTYNDNKQPNINIFCNYFNVIKTTLLHKDYINLLSTQGTRSTIRTTGMPLPDRRDDRTKEVLDITVNTVYTVQEIEEAFRSWEER